jgi:predicted nucleotidyltransferase
LPLLKQYDVIRASIFGSYAIGQPNAESDIDFLIEFTGRKSLLDLGGLKMDLEEILEKNVDVLTFDSIHTYVQDGILREQISIL